MYSGTTDIIYEYMNGALSKVKTYAENDNGTAYEEYNHTYDVFGNQLSVSVGNMALSTNTYAPNNGKLTSSTYGNGVTVNYFYDHLDRVEKKCYNNNEDTAFLYLYNGLGALASVTDTATQEKISYVYDTVGRPSEIRPVNGDIIAILNTSGEVVVTYEYDPWGNILSTSGSLASTLGADNPFRYRGYYYDTESGLYYLQTRYYDAAIGRFINADGLTSTGQGLLGNNMYAYCGNDPVNKTDTTGQFWNQIVGPIKASLEAVIDNISAYVRAGCKLPQSDVGAAAEYVEVPGSFDKNDPNCYSFAIGSPVNEQPGAASNRIPKRTYDVYDVGESVKADLRAKGYTVRQIAGANSKVYSNEFKIALRVGTKPFACVYTFGRYDFKYDYHFMAQMSDGAWAEKHGISENSNCWPVGETPDTIPWTLGGVPYYDSPIIYYAVGR